MNKNYNVMITNGVGTESLLTGNYDVSAFSTGYDSNTITPSNVTIVEGTTEYNFTISATGTLTLHVTEDGTATGVDVVGASFVRCDSLGNEYGNLITTDSEGKAIFNNVPFAASSAPTIYYKQKNSDGNHEFDDSLKNIIMTTSSETIEIVNSIPTTKTINLTDANYDNLKIDSALLTFNN